LTIGPFRVDTGVVSEIEHLKARRQSTARVIGDGATSEPLGSLLCAHRKPLAW
jgi:hypothetical protein